MNKFSTGGIIKNNADRQPKVLSGGKILVKKSVYDSHGQEFIRAVNNSKDAEIIIIDDCEYEKLTHAERAILLNT